MYSKMISTLVSRTHHFFFVVKTFKINGHGKCNKNKFLKNTTLSNSQVCNTELSTGIIMLCVRSSELAYTLTNISHFPHSQPCVIPILLSVSF